MSEYSKTSDKKSFLTFFVLIILIALILWILYFYGIPLLKTTNLKGITTVIAFLVAIILAIIIPLSLNGKNNNVNVQGNKEELLESQNKDSKGNLDLLLIEKFLDEISLEFKVHLSHLNDQGKSKLYKDFLFWLWTRHIPKIVPINKDTVLQLLFETQNQEYVKIIIEDEVEIDNIYYDTYEEKKLNNRDKDYINYNKKDISWGENSLVIPIIKITEHLPVKGYLKITNITDISSIKEDKQIRLFLQRISNIIGIYFCFIELKQELFKV